MNTKNKFISAMIMLMALVMSVSLTSCNSDDDPDQVEVTYQVKLTQMELAGNADFNAMKAEADQIVAAYDAVLGADAQHKVTAKTSDVDALNAQVASLASRVNTELQAVSWKNYISIEIENVTYGETVYKASYSPR